MRAIAVLPVLIFHAFPNLIPGGFFGVDVFFVISGYLISGIIFRGLLSGTFSYKTFYEKRIKRIIPNLFLVLSFVAVLGYFFLLSDEYKNLGRHIYSSAAFIQNFRLLSDVGYFTEDALRQPLLHLWSLAIEEQFYIIFPIICTLIWRFKKSATLIGASIILITLSSFTACMLVQDRNFNFYFPLTRFWELGAGICLAYIESYSIFKARNLALGLRHTLSVLGLAAVLAPMFFWSSDMVHPGWITLLPVLGALSLIAANPDAAINKTLLSWRPITFVGLISYSLYLWHWPLLAFLFICHPAHSTELTFIALAMSFIIASAVYYFVENPVRRSTTYRGIPTGFVLIALLSLAFIGGKFIRSFDGLPSRTPIKNMALISKNIMSDQDEWDDFEKLNRLSFKKWFIRTQNKTTEIPSIIFAGDSHVEQYFRKALALENQTGHPVGFLTHGGCSIFDPSLTDYKRNNCAKASDALYELIKNKHVKTLVIGQMWGQYSVKEEFEQSIKSFKLLLQQRPDLKVFVILDAPWSKNSVELKRNFNPKFHFNRFTNQIDEPVIECSSDEIWNLGNQKITLLMKDVATIISTDQYVCHDRKCDLVKWYRDANHLKPSQLEKEAVWVEQIFRDTTY